MGVSAGIKDTPHGSKPILTENAKAWVIHLACSKPKELGYAAEVWSRQALASMSVGRPWLRDIPAWRWPRKPPCNGFWPPNPCNPTRSPTTWNAAIPTSKARCETSCWCIKRWSCRIRDRFPADPPAKVITVSVDEKPGVQAIANTAPDLRPVPGRHPTLARDHEYERLGTCSILAALDLHTGHVTAQVQRRHRSREFIALLKDWTPLSARLYPPADSG